MQDILAVVIAPVLLGVMINHAAPRPIVERAAVVAPPLATGVVALVVSSVIARNSQGVIAAGSPLLAALFVLHGGGFFLGYAISRALGVGERASRTNSIEVGMQNSTLGAVLAAAHIAPMAAVPCAFSSVMHSLLGSALAAWWRWRDSRIPHTQVEDI